MRAAQILLAQTSGADNAESAVVLMVLLGIIVLTTAGLWATFEKAGKPGWASIVPIYNMVVLLDIAGKPLWWILLFFIPLLGLVLSLLIAVDVARGFGKGAGFGLGLGLLPFVFYPILGFGDAEYEGV